MVLHPTERKRRELAAAKNTLGPGVLSQVIELPIDQLIPYAQNARTHGDEQVTVIEQSIQTFGWMNPVLIGDNNEIIAGHGRILAAKRLGLTHAPVLRVSGLTPDQIRGYRLADNRIAEIAGWDADILAVELQHITGVDIGSSIEALGWKMPQIEVLLDTHAQSQTTGEDSADNLPPTSELSVSKVGDLWLCGDNRVLCGSAIDAAALSRLMGGKKAQLICQDPPWNLAVKSIVGSGRIKHREFVMGSGEMSAEQFRQFLRDDVRCNAKQAVPGAVFQVFIDWRGVEKVITAGEAEGLELLNVLVWVKTNGGMSGGPWRSQHELVVVFRKPGAKIKNRVELGKYGRYRTNVLQVAGLNSFGKGRMEALESHPTRKPVELIAELIRDVTDTGDIVLDSFLGSGTALIAAERTGRTCYGMELDPLYVDTIVRRWEQFTGKQALLEGSGRTFKEVEVERSAGTEMPPLRPVRSRVRRIAA
jgi:DNA modification methylase